MAAFPGCDYIKQLHGNGPNKVFNTVLPGYQDAENKSEYIIGLCGADQNYLKRFNCVTSLYQHTLAGTLLERLMNPGSCCHYSSPK
jgi:hypothetical protein